MTKEDYEVKLRWKSIKNKPRLGSLCLLKRKLLGVYKGATWGINCITHVEEIPVSTTDKWAYFRDLNRMLDGN